MQSSISITRENERERIRDVPRHPLRTIVKRIDLA